MRSFKVKCPRCGGDGREPGKEIGFKAPCHKCGGKKWIRKG